MRLLEPRKPFGFNIFSEHVKNAVCKDKNKCVIVQALSATGKVMSAEVGASITTIVTRRGCERYQTSKVLRDGLSSYDLTGKWDLPEGYYELMPVAKSQTKKAVRDKSRERRANGDTNMFHDRRIYPRKKLNLNPRQIFHRELVQLGAA